MQSSSKSFDFSAAIDSAASRLRSGSFSELIDKKLGCRKSCDCIIKPIFTALCTITKNRLCHMSPVDSDKHFDLLEGNV